MAKRIFISFLGATRYSECWYTIDGEKLTTEPVRFVQEALIQHFCMNSQSPWCERDRVLIFCTHHSDVNNKDGAKEINWLDREERDRTTNEVTMRQGLKTRLELLKGNGLQPVVEMVEIPSGFDEKEVWGIFSTVYDKLREVLLVQGDQQEGDVQYEKGEIYFDVTHAFRSIPLFSLVLFNHTKVLLGTELKAIKYGAFEAAPQVIDPDTGKPAISVAPVLDMTSIARLQTYNQLASDFKEFGKTKKLGSELERSTADAVTAQFAKALNQLHDHIITINQKGIKSGGFIKDLNRSVDKLLNRDDIAQPFKNIIIDLKRSLRDFGGGYANIEAAIRWAHKYDMLMQAYSLAKEYIVTRVLQYVQDDMPDGLKPREQREFISSILSVDEDAIDDPTCLRGATRTYHDEARTIWEYQIIEELHEPYVALQNSRNSLDHGLGWSDFNTLKQDFLIHFDESVEVIHRLCDNHQ